jgi:hypothetical protein
MNDRIRFRWLAKARSGNEARLCHQQRCTEPALANRLCGEHLAWWTTQLSCQPPMPDYETQQKTIQTQMHSERRQADFEYKRIAGLPMRNLSDAAVMKDEAQGADMLIELLRQSKHDSLKPLLEQAASIKKAHDEAIARYIDCRELAKLRLNEFDHLHDFEVGKSERPAPRHSGIETLGEAAEPAPVHVRKVR